MADVARSIRNLYNFREQRFSTASHALRVYIYGADVTAWLKGDLSVTYGNRDSYNTASFELANPRKVFQLTRDNLAGTWNQKITANHEYSEKPKYDIFLRKNNDSINPYFNLDINENIIGSKGQDSADHVGSQTYKMPGTLQERRWRLAVNDCIFSKMDPIRIFMQNPFGMLDPNHGEWLEIFCGFVMDHPVTTNYTTGESSVRVNCTCIRHMMTKMRVQMSPRSSTDYDASPTFQTGFFADFMDPSEATHPFPRSSLEQAIKKLILGTETPKQGEGAFKNGALGKATGIGDFKLGNTICFDSRSVSNLLERWHLMTIFGVNKKPFPSKSPQNDDLWLTTAEMTKIGEGTIYTPNLYAQGPQGRYLHFLLPSDGTGAGALVQSTFDAPLRGMEWTTRWDIIRDFAKALDFQVLTSPSGDILVEFPMYGFTPAYLLHQPRRARTSYARSHYAKSHLQGGKSNRCRKPLCV